MTKQKFVSREFYKNYVQKATEFYDEMEDAFSRGHWNACVANAVHAAISSVDALAVQRLGKKNSAESHVEAVVLLDDIKSSDENRKSNLKYEIIELVKMKTPSEYEERLMSKADAERAVNRCKKIYSFILGEIKKGEV